MTRITLSPQGQRAIQQREGLVLTAYRCPAGVWTIGVGHTGRDVTPGLKITREKAMALFAADVKPTEDLLNDEGEWFRRSVKPYEFDALVSFVFNVGAMRYSKSTLRRLLRQGADKKEIARQFLRWIYITNGKGEKIIAPGLARRRLGEALQFIGYPQQLHDLGYPEELIGDAAAFLPYDKQAHALGYTPELI